MRPVQLVLTTPSDVDTLISDAVKREWFSFASGFKENVLASYFDAAKEWCEDYTNRSFLNQVYTYYLDDWPRKEIIYLPQGQLQSLNGGADTITYRDSAGSTQTLTKDTDFRIETNGIYPRIIPINSWPAVDADRRDNITIVFTAGYGALAADVPKDLIHAIGVKAKSDYEGTQGCDTTGAMTAVRCLLNRKVLMFDYGLNE